MKTKPISALIKGLSDLGYGEDKISSEVATAMAAKTHHDDRVASPAHSASTNVLLQKLTDAGQAWAIAKAKAEKPESDDDDEDYEGEGGDDGDGDEDDEAEAMAKGGVEMTPDIAAQVIAQAIGDSLGPKLAKAFARLADRIDSVAARTDAIGDNNAVSLEVQRELLTKGSTVAAPAAPAKVDTALIERLDRLEKALGSSLDKIEQVLRAPAGGFRGIVDMSEVEVAKHPGDDADPTKPMAKGVLDAAAFVHQGLLAKQAAAARTNDRDTVQRMHTMISTLSLFPSQAPAIAAEAGITL